MSAKKENPGSKEKAAEKRFEDVKIIRNICVKAAEIDLPEKIKFEHKFRFRTEEGRYTNVVKNVEAEKGGDGSYIYCNEYESDVIVVKAPDSAGNIKVFKGAFIRLEYDIARKYMREKCVEYAE